MRINKFIASATKFSRRQADELILSGQIRVNGVVCKNLSTEIKEGDQVTLNDKLLKPTDQKVVYLLNKPKGVITTAKDPLNRPTVTSLVPKSPRVFPCGRLDAETMGLVVLTNDGNLCYQLTHPKFRHQKEYHVIGLAKNPELAWKKLQQPIKLKDGGVTIDRLELRKIHQDKIDFLITIHDGRNHIIRRLCAAVGIEVLQLTRTRLGQFELGDIKPGQYVKINLPS
jgi:23S rRNA pseudouridine2605 synthase